MTQEQHPITPPQELVREWAKGCSPYDVPADHIATQAAGWGADKELEACRKEIVDGAGRLYIDDPKLRVRLADDICAARRPKPPSLKEQALDELDRVQTHDESGQEIVNLSVIRRALEALPD